MARSGLPLCNVTVLRQQRVGGRHTSYTSELESWDSCYAPIVLAGDHDVPRTNSLSSSRGTSSTALARFDLREFSEPSFARSLVPDVRRPSSRQLARAVFAHPVLVDALARFAGSKFVARADLLAFFVAAGATSRPAAQSSASTYVSLRALLVWLVPELTLSVPVVADVPSSFVLPRHSGLPRTSPSPLCLYCGQSPPAGGRELCEECELFVALILRERQMRRTLDLPCGVQLACLICATSLSGNSLIVCSREKCRMAHARIRGRARNHAAVLRGSLPLSTPHTSLVFGDPLPGFARVARLRGAAFSALRSSPVPSQLPPVDVPPILDDLSSAASQLAPADVPSTLDDLSSAASQPAPADVPPALDELPSGALQRACDDVEALFDDTGFASVLARFGACASVTRIELFAFFFAAGASRAASESAVARCAEQRELLASSVTGALGGVPQITDGDPVSMPLVRVAAVLTDFQACMRCLAIRAPHWRAFCDDCQLFVALVLREQSLRSAAGFPTTPLSECVFCAGFLPAGDTIACSLRCRLAGQSLLDAVHHVLSSVRRSTEAPARDVALLFGPAPLGLAHVRMVRDDALAALRRDVPDPPAPEPFVPCLACARPFQVPGPHSRSLILCPDCVVRAVAAAASAHADSSRSHRSSCVVCRGVMSRRTGALTCSTRCRMRLYRARRRLASLAVASSGSSPDVDVFVPDPFSPAQRADARVAVDPVPLFDASREPPGSNGVDPAGPDAPGVTALRAAVAASVSAGVAADARRGATAANCSALVEGAAAAVADCARAFADAGCTVEPEPYRGVARAGFDVDGFRARFAAVPVEVRVIPLGGVYTVHGVRSPLVQRFALYRAELRDVTDCHTWAWHIEVDRTGSVCVVVPRGLSRHVLCTPESAFAERCAFARELDALAAGFAHRVTAVPPRARGGTAWRG